jgi:polar amino acid transport system substrate-binding protein
MTRFLFVCALGAVLVLCPSFWALAADGGVPSVVVVGSPPEGWPPFLIPPPGDACGRGIMLDVMAEITRSLGCESRLELYPEKRSRLLLSEGGIHAYPKAREWMDDPEEYVWSDAVVVSSDVLVSRSGEPLLADSLDDMAGLSIGVIHGFHYPAISRAVAAGTVTTYPARDTEAALRMLQRGHVDTVVTNRAVAEWIIRNRSDLHAADFVFAAKPIDSAPYRFAFFKSGQWQRFAELFNAELAAMKRDGRLDRILARYR